MLSGGAEHHDASDYDAVLRSGVRRPHSMTMLLPLCVISPMSEGGRSRRRSTQRRGAASTRHLRSRALPRPPSTAGASRWIPPGQGPAVTGELEDDEMVRRKGRMRCLGGGAT